jgi:AGCS family alanine or glycine:cation symporter
MDYLFDVIATLNSLYWSYIGWAVICAAGFYFTIISRGFQFQALGNFKNNIKDILQEGGNKANAGIHPVKLYFASVGGMVGLTPTVVKDSILAIGVTKVYHHGFDN